MASRSSWFIAKSSAGRRAAWRSSVEQAFDRVIPEVVPAVRHGRPRRPRLIHILAVVALSLAGCSAGVAPSPTPSVAPTPTSEPTPAMTRAEIVFGTKYDDNLVMTDPKSSFKRTVPRIAWSVQLTGPAGATTLTWILATRSSSGTERELVREEVPVSDPTFDVFANSADLATLVGHKAGTYVMRYARGATIIAEGTFALK